jgi:hypothetical protein
MSISIVWFDNVDEELTEIMVVGYHIRIVVSKRVRYEFNIYSMV